MRRKQQPPPLDPEGLSAHKFKKADDRAHCRLAFAYNWLHQASLGAGGAPIRVLAKELATEYPDTFANPAVARATLEELVRRRWAQFTASGHLYADWPEPRSWAQAIRWRVFGRPKPEWLVQSRY